MIVYFRHGGNRDMVRKILFIIIGCIFFMFLFSGCLMCDIRHDLWNKDRTLYDFSGGNGSGCALEFKVK